MPVRSLANIVRRKQNLGHCRYSWSVRQKESTEKEKIRTWGIWEIQGSEQQRQEVLEKKAKGNWIGEQCSEIEENPRKNDRKRAYQLVKDLTTVKQGKATTIQDRSGKCLTEERQILNRWTKYCSELYNQKANGDPSVLNCPETHTHRTSTYPSQSGSFSTS